MNYRHAFHAGNHADVLKHVVLLALLDALKRKPAPFFVLDTHAGRGRYTLRGGESRRTEEADHGIGRLAATQRLPPVVEAYLAAVAAHNPPGRFEVYPGSPLLVATALREQDRMVACELQPKEADALTALFAHEARVAVRAGDGYQAIKALLPPRFGSTRDDRTRFARGLVLIDPPYEAQQDEYPRVLAALRDGLTRWPQATFAVWYPIKQRRSLQQFMRKAAAMPAKSVLRTELLIRPDDSPLRLNGSGMLVFNPPWQLDEQLAPAAPALAQALGEERAQGAVDWLRREGSSP